MRIPRGALPALAAIALIAGACGGDPVATPSPSPIVSPAATATPGSTVIPFAPAPFPADGTACGTPGYAGRLGRIEAVDATTIQFTLCAPDGAFLARLAHPALDILDSSSIERLAVDPGATTLAGTGPYRIDRWVPGENVALARVDAKASDVARSPLVVLTWAGDPAVRTSSLTEATVDGIDAPGPAELDQIATLPELVVTPRPGMATAILVFGSGPAFAGARVRRAIAGAIDRATLTATAFPAGSLVPTHLTPCIVPGACGGRAWYDFNAPAASAVLADASFDLERTYPLHVPDAPLPGLPDPLGAAQAVKDQLAANIGLTTEIDVMPAADFRAAAAAGRLDGLYLDGIASSVADASGFLEPVFGDGVRTTPARRASGVTTALVAAAATADPEARAAAIGRANTAIRSSAVVVPLAHPGSVVAFRSDVDGVATSPLGLDPLGAATPGDRPQLVFQQAAEPAGAWCGDQPSFDAYRLCGLVFEGLYGFAAGTLEPQPRLARACTADATATVWTCRLRSGVTFGDGSRVDAGDVLATFVAQWDAAGPIRSAAAPGAFAAWDELFGGPVNAGG
ncbi:MAG TPA: ABC transporter substrate-binding protein [Candidatus Limnocylindrales bacterium]|nr:ABC transporter substrate-binding protein [Candidatus Limnocylindrales bacterium]